MATYVMAFLYTNVKTMFYRCKIHVSHGAPQYSSFEMKRDENINRLPILAWHLFFNYSNARWAVKVETPPNESDINTRSLLSKAFALISDDPVANGVVLPAKKFVATNF